MEFYPAFPNGSSTEDANLPDHSFRDEKFMLGVQNIGLNYHKYSGIIHLPKNHLVGADSFAKFVAFLAVRGKKMDLVTLVYGIILLIVVCNIRSAIAVESQPVKLSVDAGNVVGDCDNLLWANLGYDPLYSRATSDEVQPVWRMIRDSRAFRYIRRHD